MIALLCFVFPTLVVIACYAFVGLVVFRIKDALTPDDEEPLLKQQYDMVELELSMDCVNITNEQHEDNKEIERDSVNITNEQPDDNTERSSECMTKTNKHKHCHIKPTLVNLQINHSVT